MRLPIFHTTNAPAIPNTTGVAESINDVASVLIPVIAVVSASGTAAWALDTPKAIATMLPTETAAVFEKRFFDPFEDPHGLNVV